MYKCYRLEDNLELKSLISGYESIGKIVMDEKRANIKRKLEEYVRKDELIDFTDIQSDWFPTVEADIFISHSHKDIKIINALVGWLHTKFKVSVFVDSYIWGYSNELLKELDNKYCRHTNGESYDYDKRNFSTAHVHMMLANSLNKMIDKSECVIFLETDNSISLNNSIETGTSSAWIYSELIATTLIATRVPKRYEDKSEEIRKHFNLTESMNPLYRVSLDHLIKLNSDDLENIAQEKLDKGYLYLDKLYSLECSLVNA